MGPPARRKTRRWRPTALDVAPAAQPVAHRTRPSPRWSQRSPSRRSRRKPSRIFPPLGPLPAKAHRSWVGTLFEFHQPGGAEYRASLNVTPPVTSADPNWAAASSAMPYYNESGVNMNWLVEASQPGTVRFSRGSSRSSTLLQLDAKMKLRQAAVRL